MKTPAKKNAKQSKPAKPAKSAPKKPAKAEKSVKIDVVFAKILCAKNRDKVLKEYFAEELIKVLSPKDKKGAEEFRKNSKKLLSQFEIKSKSAELYLKNGKKLELIGIAK